VHRSASGLAARRATNIGGNPAAIAGAAKIRTSHVIACVTLSRCVRIAAHTIGASTRGASFRVGRRLASQLGMGSGPMETAVAVADSPAHADAMLNTGGNPAYVTIVRGNPDDVGDRQMFVSLDGERIATLMFGQKITRDVGPGLHRLRISNTLFWKSVTFTVKPGQRVQFEIVNRAGRLTYGMFGLIGLGPLYVGVERVA